MVKCKDFGEVTVVVIRNDCGIRTKGFFDEDDELWFFAEDLVNSLEYTEPAVQVVQKYCDDAVIGAMTVGGRKKNCMVVPERDMWSLLLHAPSEGAREFQRFVCEHLMEYHEEMDNVLCMVIDEE